MIWDYILVNNRPSLFIAYNSLICMFHLQDKSLAKAVCALCGRIIGTFHGFPRMVNNIGGAAHTKLNILVVKFIMG